MTGLEAAYLNGIYAAASWHRRQADGFRLMSRDEPRLSADIRMKAAQAASHHGASAVGLTEFARHKTKEFERDQD